RPDLRDRRLIVSGDTTYTTRLTLQGLPDNTTFIGRIRKDANLCYPVAAGCARLQSGRPRCYGPLAPTPEQILQDETMPWTIVRCFAAGQFRDIPVKTIGPVYWRNNGMD